MVLLFFQFTQIRSWATQVLRDLPGMKIDRMHKYITVTNALLNLITYQTDLGNEIIEPVLPGKLPERLPSYLYSKSPVLLFLAFQVLFKLLPSRLLRISLSSGSNKEFLLCFVRHMKGNILFVCFQYLIIFAIHHSG